MIEEAAGLSAWHSRHSECSSVSRMHWHHACGSTAVFESTVSTMAAGCMSCIECGMYFFVYSRWGEALWFYASWYLPWGLKYQGLLFNYFPVLLLTMWTTGTRMYETKKRAAQKTIEKKDVKVKIWKNTMSRFQSSPSWCELLAYLQEFLFFILVFIYLFFNFIFFFLFSIRSTKSTKFWWKISRQPWRSCARCLVLGVFLS